MIFARLFLAHRTKSRAVGEQQYNCANCSLHGRVIVKRDDIDGTIVIGITPGICIRPITGSAHVWDLAKTV